MRNPIQSIADLTKYAVNRKDQMEVVRQGLYDFQTYTAAGTAGQILFFQVPQGQGTPAKTFADTNMTTAGTLAAPQRFLVQAIELYFYPGPNPSLATGAGAIDNFVNDVYLFYKATASARLFIGSKIYLEEAPPLRFPPFTKLTGFAASHDQSATAASQFQRTSYMTATGRPYIVDPPVLLEPTQNFSMSLNYPAAQAVSANARVGFVLGGLLVRNSQ
jgi:hypothetical protein